MSIYFYFHKEVIQGCQLCLNYILILLFKPHLSKHFIFVLLYCIFGCLKTEEEMLTTGGFCVFTLQKEKGLIFSEKYVYSILGFLIGDKESPEDKVNLT